jgi:hypothetical protein
VRLPLEVAAVWLLFAVVAVEILVTYSRLPAPELYHVSGSGFEGGLGRLLVFLNFPVALVAVAILAFLADRLPGRLLPAAALGGIVLSAAVFWPGVVKQSDLDARPVNAIAAIGVGVAVVLTAIVWSAGRLERSPRRRADPARAAVAIVVLLVALPWAAADLGFYLDGVPVLGWIFQTGDLRSQPNVLGLHPAVHHGHHHGMDGTLLVLTALLLSRALPAVRGPRVRSLLRAYLSLMLCYGVGNVANDAWVEQVVKRGWTDWEIPDVTQPKATVAWGIIVVAAAALWAVSAPTRRARSAPLPRRSARPSAAPPGARPE